MAARLAEELPVLLRERPWEGATLVVDGAPRLDHHRDAEVVVAPPVAPPRPLTGQPRRRCG